MAKSLQDKIKDKLNELRIQRGQIEDSLEEYREQLELDTLEANQVQELQNHIDYLEKSLNKIDDEISEVKGNKRELSEIEREASDYKWRDIEPLLAEAVEKYYINYCVENNKFLYCIDMASKIKDELNTEYTVVNPQFRMFEASRIQLVISKMINKYLVNEHHKLIKWFMVNNRTHFQSTASFLTAKWNSDKVYNKASIIRNFWVEPDLKNKEDYNKDFDILLHCVGGGKEQNIHHLEIWPVYKYLFPERVANTPNLDICGPTGANGKGRYLELNKTIFTYGCVSPGTAKELSDGFNASWEMSTLIYFDEPTEKELAHNKVKNATGGEEQRIEKKGIDAYTADRNYSIMALSNNEHGVFRLEGSGMAGQDRRFSVISTDIVMIDEIMRREKCSFDEATVRVNQIAQLVKDRKEVAKWMGHIMVKHDIAGMMILPPLHGEDYTQRFEDQKDRYETIFDLIYPVFVENAIFPTMLLKQIVDSLLSTEKKKIDVNAKSLNNKFKYYLLKKKVDFDKQDRRTFKILFNGELCETYNDKTVFYYSKQNDTIPTNFELKNLSSRPYSKEFGLSKDRLSISID